MANKERKKPNFSYRKLLKTLQSESKYCLNKGETHKTHKTLNNFPFMKELIYSTHSCL